SGSTRCSRSRSSASPTRCPSTTSRRRSRPSPTSSPERYALTSSCLNKADLIEQIAQAAEISKSAAERAVDALVGAVKSSLRKDEMVTLVGFGTFYAGKRAARTGRNPRTGAALDIKAARLPKFRAGKALKDAIN